MLKTIEIKKPIVFFYKKSIFGFNEIAAKSLDFIAGRSSSIIGVGLSQCLFRPCVCLNMAKKQKRDIDKWMPLWIGDYLSDTMDLTTEEHGAYLLMLFHMWKTGGYVYNSPKNMAAVCKLTPSRFKKTWKKLIKYFSKNDHNFWYKNKVLEELQIAQESSFFYHNRAKTAATARWNNALRNASRNASRMLRAGDGAGNGEGISEKDNFIKKNTELRKAENLIIGDH